MKKINVIVCSDINGKIIYSDSKMLNSGYNQFTIDSHKLVTGSYNLQIIGNSVYFSDKLLKQ